MQAPWKRSYLLNNFLRTSILFTFGFASLSANPSDSIFFSNIEFRIVKNGLSAHHYIWIHGDEKTAEMALNHHLKHYPGKVFFIQSEHREVSVAGTIVDPNRLFSRKGAESALRKFKPNWNQDDLSIVLDKLDAARQPFLHSLFPPDCGLLIAVHNNFRGYNIKKEFPVTRLKSIKTNQNLRDFILCTDEEDFHRLSDGPFNVILQDEMPDEDNGSLSWAAIRNGVRYINIETRLGWLSQQKKMLRFVEDSLE